MGLLAAESDPENVPELLPPLALKTMSVEELMALHVVSVSRKPESWSEAASNVFLLTDQSWKITGADRLPELLRLAPNLFVAQASSAQWAVNARGFVRSNSASNKLLVMVDGRSVYSPLFSNVFWDTTNVFLPDLQQIEVISGPAGTTWGSNAVNGVINIQTKSALDTIGVLAYADAGTAAMNAGLRVGWKLWDRGALRVYVQHNDNEASLTNTGAEDGKDSWKATQGGFRGDWKGGTAAVTISGDIYHERQHNGASPEGINDGYNFITRWSRDLSSGSHVWARVYYDYAKRDSQVDLVETTKTTDFEFQHVTQFDNGQEFLWGANHRLISDNFDEAETFAILPGQLDSTLSSVFVQHEIGFFENALRLTTGLRLEHNHYSGWESQPSARLAWSQPGQTVWVAVSRATRIPSRLDADLYIPKVAPFVLAGGPDIRAETVRAHELGWRIQPMENFSFTATGYYNDYDHLRSLELTTPVVISNGVEGRSYGVELFMDWGVRPWWRMRVGGFRMNQETWMKPGGADLDRGQGESSFPKYQALLRNTFRLGESFSLWAALRRVAAVPIYDSGATQRVPAYTELDLNLTWTIHPGVDISITGRNLLHAEHPEIGAYATQRQIPRSVEAGMKFQY